ncbi:MULTISPECIES: HNH endonuclease [unclassified Acidovorax]|uniref:HNH endonuclease n=1 Tax=unclassified Acidovorax TaxID=2684926 RepID=UPI001E3AB9E9|nr:MULTISPECIES: HNH endonuclease [unclassified Acidovorax]
MGFNRVNDDGIVVQALSTLEAEDNPLSPPVLPDIDLPAAGTEGAAHLVSHLRRERNQAIVEAKKAAILNAKGRLCCEVCGFDFFAHYGVLGAGFCEVHHLVPLSAATESVTATLDALAILCSNCHRIIHRSTPMLSVVELSQLVIRGRP